MSRAALSAYRALPWILLLIVLSRVFLIAFLNGVDIHNDSGVAVRFAGAPAYLDYGLYRSSSADPWGYITRPIVFLKGVLDNPSQAIDWLMFQPIWPGPFLPEMINLFGYQESQFGLALAYLVAGSALGLIWAWGLAQRGIGIVGQVLAAVFPPLVYYSFLVSTDLLYAVVIAGLFISSLWALSGGKMRYWLVAMAILVALLTRPNAIALLGAVVLLPFFRRETATLRLIWVIFCVCIGLYAFIYYLPYYFVHDGNAGRTHYWGIYPSEYYSGLFAYLPEWIDRPLSIGIFAISKVLHASGIRPSYAGLDWWLVVARSLPGLLFLPGMVYGLLRAGGFERIFIACFLLPVFVGAAQERYLLPIAPLLIIWAFCFYKDMAVRFGLSRISSR